MRTIKRHLRGFWEKNKDVLNPKIILIGVAAIAVIALGLFLFISFVFQPANNVPQGGSLPEVTEDELVPTDLTQTMNDFGPWASPSINSQGIPVMDSRALILLREDGGMRVAQLGISYPADVWRKNRPIAISAMSRKKDSDNILIETNKDRQFTIQTDQPFILEQSPLTVYLIDSHGEFWSVSREEALILKYKL